MTERTGYIKQGEDITGSEGVSKIIRNYFDFDRANRLYRAKRRYNARVNSWPRKTASRRLSKLPDFLITGCLLMANRS